MLGPAASDGTRQPHPSVEVFSKTWSKHYAMRKKTFDLRNTKGADGAITEEQRCYVAHVCAYVEAVKALVAMDKVRGLGDLAEGEGLTARLQNANCLEDKRFPPGFPPLLGPRFVPPSQFTSMYDSTSDTSPPSFAAFSLRPVSVVHNLFYPTSSHSVLLAKERSRRRAGRSPSVLSSACLTTSTRLGRSSRARRSACTRRRRWRRGGARSAVGTREGEGEGERGILQPQKSRALNGGSRRLDFG